MPKFKRGESVVCIDDDFRWAQKKYADAHLNFPVRGKCYVVRAYAVHGSHPAVLLAEITNPFVIYNDGKIREAGFWEERFEKAPSIEQLKRIAESVGRRRLKRIPTKEDA